MAKFEDLFQKPFIFLDGAMGTMLQSMGLKLGERPEILCMTNPEQIGAIHKQYLDAGSDIVYTNTFGANRYKLEGTGYSVEEVIKKAVKIAKKACENAGKDAFAALDIGPIGELLEPSGLLSFEEAYDIFREMVICGEKAGADVIVFETMTDLYEIKAGILAAKENTSLPVFATMTFEENGRTFTGCTVESMAVVLEGLGVDAIGINCSMGPKEILPLAQRLARSTNLPIIIKANAGLPDPANHTYSIDAKEFASLMRPYAESGIRIMGGCCGTTPEYIKNLCEEMKGLTFGERKPVVKSVLCSPPLTVEVDGVKVIGERINPTGKKRFQQALKEGDLEYIAQCGIEQADAGADILDVNVGLPGIDEKEMMIKAVKTLQSVISLPLQIDSSHPETIEAGLRVCNGKAIVNSVNGEQKVMDRIFPIVKKYGAAVIGLTMDERGLPKTAEERFEIAKKICETAKRYGIKKEDVFIDCLALTVSAQQEQAKETLKAIRRVKEELGVHTVLGVSNISFGLPERDYITLNFLIQAMTMGLDLPIVNPNKTEIMDAVYSFKVLSGEDKNSENYIARFSGRKTQTVIIENGSKEEERKNDPVSEIEYAISKGLKEETKRITKKLLEEKSELQIVNQVLIPILDRIGEKYEKQEIFLPQLIHSADASCEAFEVIKTSILSKGAPTIVKDKILLATVKGDIHDIGKNIVKVILENYGYQIIDLGKDVPIETVVKTAIEEDAKLVGLSALMTTTVESMKNTILAIRESGHECKIMVGGAVLTPEYAKEIGADYYGKDAKQAVDAAKAVIG